jgi:uncharacterized protein
VSPDRIVVPGGSGFIGRSLIPALARAGYDAVVLSRFGTPIPGARVAVWDGRSPGDWARELDGAAAIINLAGRSIDCRHTPRHRDEILRSRLDSVSAIARAISACARPPAVWVQAGGIGYYGDRGDEALDESAPPGTGFLADVCRAWEDALAAAPAKSARKLMLRIGVVLGRAGSALRPLARLARWGLGGRVGSGRQYISWIHMDDTIGIILRALTDTSMEGILNATAPEPVTNEAFMRTLRRVLGRPWSPPIPALSLRLGARLIGTEASLALEGCRVLPRRLESMRHAFRFSHLEPALRDLVAREHRAHTRKA